jgi:hypothetical protein
MAVLPYAGTSGWSGSSTSLERALLLDSSGLTGKNQTLFLDDLANAGERGLTSREWGQMNNFEHQIYSSVPSALHEAGFVARLSESRGRHQVYVLPEFVNGRETKAHGRKKPNKALDAVADVLCGCLCCHQVESRLEQL